MLSDILQFKNCRKRPTITKIFKKHVVISSYFVYISFVVALNGKNGENGQKWPKTAFLTIFGEFLPPRW